MAKIRLFLQIRITTGIETKRKAKEKHSEKCVFRSTFFFHLFSYFLLLLQTYRIIQLILKEIEENFIRKSDKQTNIELAIRAKSSDTQHDTSAHTHIRQVSHGNVYKTARTHSQANNRNSNRNEIETLIQIRFEPKIENKLNYIEIKIFTAHAWNT